MRAESQQLATVLRGSKALSPQDLDLSIRQAKDRNVSLWDILVTERHLPEDQLAEALSARLNLPRVQIASTEVDRAAVKAVAGSIARKHTCLPIRLEGKKLVVAMFNPMDRQAKDDVQFASNRVVEPVVASRSEILAAIEQHYPLTTAAQTSVANVPPSAIFSVTASENAELDLDQADSLDAPDKTHGVMLCNDIVRGAIEQRASDIHIEPGPHDTRVRLRIDGVLRDYTQLPRWMHPALVSRIKVLAKLDIAQQRLPQDGRVRGRRHGRGIELRVSTLPTHHGEKVVMRLLESTAIPALSKLGLSQDEMDVLDDALNQPQGLIFITGPTGAGKSTTLYSMLARRQSPEVNIVTIEDPIEYQLPGANQVQVDARSGLTFASSLRSVLRQDPDVILVGEIRDLETAEVAFQAALTGHLVLTTLHTNSSLAAIDRLLDLGVRPLIVTAATNLILAQRLARRICQNCREFYQPPAHTLRRLHLEPGSYAFTRGRGCALCGNTGYSGRVGFFEILQLTPQLKELIRQQAPEPELKRAAMAGGTRFLLADAVSKVALSLTTVEEVLRVIRIEHTDDEPSTAVGSPRRLV